MSGDQAQRRADYVKVQQILAAELPSINLWYLDAVLVHTKRLGNIKSPAPATSIFCEQLRLHHKALHRGLRVSLRCLARSFSSRAIYFLSLALFNGEVAVDR